ncbi:hypothetical protein K6V98_01830 [Collinsella sp. AGMB00827]|uniref:DUF7601 domain-containing protein n=1 Tax=Collinsella ureilytica TaxID=2869515 RepID=A0ABS7MIC6_9ACTN|nr:DUF5979 domain-containing protein [Collinsella urealyticum]MBY4797104.1 hypothetical protein [Collinsella urealyticum]
MLAQALAVILMAVSLSLLPHANPFALADETASVAASEQSSGEAEASVAAEGNVATSADAAQDQTSEDATGEASVADGRGEPMAFFARPARASGGCYVASDPGRLYTSIEEALANAQDEDTIFLVSDVNLCKGVLTSTDRDVMVTKKKITIKSAGIATNKVNFYKKWSLSVLRDTTLNLENVTLKEASTTLIGRRERPMVSAMGELVLGNRASITVARPDLTLQKTARYQSTSAVYVGQSGTFTMRDGSVITNFKQPNTDTAGAAVIIDADGTMNLEGGSITDCSASSGGAILNKGTFNMSGGEISHCTATKGNGGAIYSGLSYAKAVNLTGGYISTCTATEDGGAIYTEQPTEISRMRIDGCSAKRGGAIFIAKGAPLTLGNTTVQSNKAARYGSAIYAAGGGQLTFNDGTIIADNIVDNFNVTGVDRFLPCAVAAPMGSSKLRIGGNVQVASNLNNGGKANISYNLCNERIGDGKPIDIIADLSEDSSIELYGPKDDTDALYHPVAVFAPSTTPSLEQAKLFFSDTGNVAFNVDGRDVRWRGACRLKQGDGDWGYYLTLSDAIKSVWPMGQEAHIEMLVDHYATENPTQSDLRTIFEIPAGKNVKITASPGDDFKNAHCTFDFPKRDFVAFRVRSGAALTLDGLNSTDESSGNGLVFSGGVSTPVESMRQIDSYRQVMLRNEGQCSINDVTFENFNSREDSNDQWLYGLLTSYTDNVRQDPEQCRLELQGTTLINNIRMYGGAIHELAGGVGVFGGKFNIGPDVLISHCHGPTGGLAVVGGAVGYFSGTIYKCSTLGNGTDQMTNQAAGGIFMSTINSLKHPTTLVVENGKIIDCRGLTSTPDVAASLGGIYVYGGSLEIHGITIEDCSTNAYWRNAGGAISLNTQKPVKANVYMDGLCIIRNNKTKHPDGNRNVNLGSDMSIDYRSIYLNVGDMDPRSEVHVWASYGDSLNLRRNSVDIPFGIASLSGVASDAKNLNTFINDRDPHLRGAASYKGWAPSNLDADAPHYPAAVIWAETKTVQVSKRLEDVYVFGPGPGPIAFKFKASSATQGYAGKVYDSDNNVINDLVTAYPEDEETPNSYFELRNGDYVRFENVSAQPASPDLEQIVITEVDERVSDTNPDTGRPVDPTAPFIAIPSGESHSYPDGVVVYGTRPAWASTVPSKLPEFCVFYNILQTTSLNVNKQVKGSYADRTKSFDFHITFHFPKGLPDSENGYKVWFSGTSSGSVQLKSGQAWPFSLKDGQDITFSNLPAGTTYELVEDGADGYRSSAKVETLSKDGKADSANIAAGAAGAGLTIDPTHTPQARLAYKDRGIIVNKVSVTNEMPEIVPTGIPIGDDTLPLWLVGLSATFVVALGVGGIVWRRRRSHHRCRHARSS